MAVAATKTTRRRTPCFELEAMFRPWGKHVHVLFKFTQLFVASNVAMIENE